MMNRLTLTGAAVAAALALAAPAMAEVSKLTVDFGFFPAGTSCQVFDTTGRVSLKTGREIEYTVNGDTARVAFRCQQPDGRAFRVAAGALLPQGNHRLVAMQVNQDDHAHIYWDDGGLQKVIVPGVLNWE